MKYIQCFSGTNVGHPVLNLDQHLLFDWKGDIQLSKNSFGTLNSHNLYLLNKFCFSTSNLKLQMHVRSKTVTKLNRFNAKKIVLYVLMEFN